MLVRDAVAGMDRLRMGRELEGTVLYWCAAYLMDDVLFDAGCAHCAGELLDWLGDRPLSRVLLTHYHEDHCGAAAALQARGVPVLAGEATAGLTREPLELQPYRELIWGGYQTFTPEPLPASMSVAGGPCQVIPTPGHSADHLAYWLPQPGLLILGDAWVAPKPRTCRPEDHGQGALDSLRVLADLEPRLMANGLGEVVEDAAQVLRGTIAYLEGMQEEILALNAKGLAVEAIVTELFGRESRMQAMTQGQFSYANFVASFLK